MSVCTEKSISVEATAGMHAKWRWLILHPVTEVGMLPDSRRRVPGFRACILLSRSHIAVESPAPSVTRMTSPVDFRSENTKHVAAARSMRPPKGCG